MIAFRGDLGAGKTVLAKGIARGLGIEDEVTSPTFTVVSEYEGRLRLHHIDAYRLGGAADFMEIGGEDLLADRGAVCLIEWSERIASVLPAGTAIIDLVVKPDGRRLARIHGEQLEDMAAVATRASAAGERMEP